jgi:hypothetical protein
MVCFLEAVVDGAEAIDPCPIQTIWEMLVWTRKFS